MLAIESICLSYIHIYPHVFFSDTPPHMRRFGIPFEGSNSLLKTQEFLVNRNIGGNAIWLANFTPVRLDNLRLISRFLETFCPLDVCCDCTGTYPAYIACVLSSHYFQGPGVGELHVARTDSGILNNIYRKLHTFEIGPFEFSLTTWLECETFFDYSINEITHEGVSVPVHITIVDVSVYCGSQSSINLAEFICKRVLVFAIKKYAIVRVLLNTPMVYTYIIIGLLAMDGHQIPYAMSVWRNLGL